MENFINKNVLLTGISGFLGSHTAIALLNKGYRVIGTLRDMNRAESIREVIAQHTPHADRLQFAEAELLDAEVWKSLTKGVDYVVHVASPFPRELPKDENELIVPAKQGTLHVLEAAAANGVKRVVLVSSIAAVVYGKKETELAKVFTEKDWTDVTNLQDTEPYFRSKTLAEKAAWDFVERTGRGMELVSILPGAMLGPVLENDYGTSANIVVKILAGKMPAMPHIGFEIVDVRAVAELLVLSMEAPHADGQRFMATAGPMTMKEIAATLKHHYPNRKISTREMPNFLAKLLSVFEPSLKPVLLDLGKTRKVRGDRAVKELGWNPGSPSDAIISCAKSVLDLKIVQ